MLENTAKQWVEYISSFTDYPEGLSKEYWEDWRPRIARACCAVNKELRNKGRETIYFFNIFFQIEVARASENGSVAGIV